MANEEIKALINLLDDPDEGIYNVVSKNIINKGKSVIPDLEKAWESSLSEAFQERLENLIQFIQFTSLQKELTHWSLTGGTSLLEGAYLVARYQYADLSYVDIRKEVDKIRQDVWLELNPNLTALEKVRIMNHIIFDIHKFSGNSANYYSPQNSFINQVLETKKGNPLSLSILYSNIAQSLDIPIYGVNLPKNFILAYKDENQHNQDSVLFYINAFNKGAVLGKREIDIFIRQQRLEPQSSFYTPCQNTEIIQRLVLNLIFSYEKLGYTEKIKNLQILLKILRSEY